MSGSVREAGRGATGGAMSDAMGGVMSSVGRLVGSRKQPRPSKDAPVVFQAAALCLDYPDADLLERLDLIQAALDGTWAEPMFAPTLAHLNGEPGAAPEAGEPGTSRLSALQAFHVQEFDLSRRHALHLSYWTAGDTRRRGQVLAEFKQVYRESGLVTALAGELPDHLPVVLEFAAADPGRGFALLQRFRGSLEMLRLGLTESDLPHAGVVAAVCRCLPGDSPSSRAEVQARYGGEAVGSEGLGTGGLGTGGLGTGAQPIEFVGLTQRRASAPHGPQPIEFVGITSRDD